MKIVAEPLQIYSKPEKKCFHTMIFFLKCGTVVRKKKREHNMEELYRKLKDYAMSDYYPFHMPGHKRQMGEMINPYQIDITEITDFDDLHHAEGVLQAIEQKAAKLFGAEESKMLINGSTVGILSAIGASVSYGGKIAVARNCHKSVYHGILLNGLESYYIYPEYLEKYGICGGVTPKEVERVLKQQPGIQAVVITSPTYEGVVSDIEGIAKVVHDFGIPLIVDEAHGAHLYFNSHFPQGAVSKGADIVINSLHKTLPSFTQTALLHMQGNYIDKKRVRQYLAMYQTSSPSYILMAGISQCLSYMEKEGSAALEALYEKLQEFYEKIAKLSKLSIVTEKITAYNSVYDFDMSKIVISCKGTQMSGEELKGMLNRKYHLELEMSAVTYCLAMTTLADSKEGIQRLYQALTESDNVCNKCEDNNSSLYTQIRAKRVETIKRAQDGVMHRVSLEESLGKISGEFVYLYPPGVPILCPGEEISHQILNLIQGYQMAGIRFQGLEDDRAQTIKVMAE